MQYHTVKQCKWENLVLFAAKTTHENEQYRIPYSYCSTSSTTVNVLTGVKRLVHAGTPVHITYWVSTITITMVSHLLSQGMTSSYTVLWSANHKKNQWLTLIVNWYYWAQTTLNKRKLLAHNNTNVICSRRLVLSINQQVRVTKWPVPVSLYWRFTVTHTEKQRLYVQLWMSVD